MCEKHSFMKMEARWGGGGGGFGVQGSDES